MQVFVLEVVGDSGGINGYCFPYCSAFPDGVSSEATIKESSSVKIKAFTEVISAQKKFLLESVIQRNEPFFSID